MNIYNRHCERQRRNPEYWIAALALRPPRNDGLKQMLLTLIICLLALPALALVTPDEQLADPALEARARAISKDIRCPLCEGQSIDESNAGVARDLRLLIRERLMAGDSDEDVIAYLQSRYGDAILMKPPVTVKTGLLWLGPFLVLMIGGGLTALFIWRAQK